MSGARRDGLAPWGFALPLGAELHSRLLTPAGVGASVPVFAQTGMLGRDFFSLVIIYQEIFLKKYFIYLFLRDAQREAETQAEGEAGSP